LKTRAYRIVKARRAEGAFDGEGARLNGGRWNSKGTRMVYTAGSRALAGLEMLVHLTSSLLRMGYVVIEAEFDSRLAKAVRLEDLPKDWATSQPTAATQALGDSWARGATSPILAVPSAIIHEELNYLFNPLHRDFARIRIGELKPFAFDSRLLE